MIKLINFHFLLSILTQTSQIIFSVILIFAAQTVFAENLSCTQRSSSYNCLLCNCFFETRGESQQGKIAVAKTVLSRVDSDEFPNTICNVVFQPSQFSWTADRYANSFNTKQPEAKQAISDCHDAVNKAIDEGANGLLYFYNPDKVTPAWARKMKSCGPVDNHVFMVPLGETCPRHLGGRPAGRKQQRRSTGGGVSR